MNAGLGSEAHNAELKLRMNCRHMQESRELSSLTVFLLDPMRIKQFARKEPFQTEMS